MWKIGSYNLTAATVLSGDKNKIMSSRGFTYPHTFHATKSASTTRAMRTRNRPKERFDGNECKLELCSF